MKNWFNIIKYYLITRFGKKTANDSGVVGRVLRFNREGKSWFVELNEWKGSHASLQMVAGADEVLETLSLGEDSVWLFVSTRPIEGVHKQIYTCEKISHSEFGSADYVVKELNNKKIWLCPVLSFVFGNSPNTIWFFKVY